MGASDNYYVEVENNQLKNNGTELLYTTLKDETSVLAHIHESIELLYILEGDMEVHADRSLYSVSPGDLILLRSNTLHSIQPISKAQCRYFVMKMKPSVLLSLYGSESGYAYVMRFVVHNNDKIHWRSDELTNTEIPYLAKLLMREFDAPATGTDVIRKTALASLLISIIRLDEANGHPHSENGMGMSVNHQIYKAIDYINKNYSSDISALDCAKEINMSYSYFSRSFKKITGKQFRHYLTEVRVSHAEKLMVISDRSVTEIAMECGFNDVSYFISQYKSLRGVTPNKFRKNSKSSGGNPS